MALGVEGVRVGVRAADCIHDPRAAPLRLTSHAPRLAMLASLPTPNRIGSTAKCPRSDQQRPHQYSPNNENRQVVSSILFALDQAPGAPTHWPSMRNRLVFLLLFAIKVASRVLFRVRLEFVREVDDPWADLRVVALLNHTSLFEPLLAARAPNRLLWQIAAHGVVPVADKTAVRPIVGRLFRFMARHVVPVTRERDETWAEVLERLRDERALIVILPEGRMKRRTGLDLDGNPMTIRGGIADILESVPDGRLFIGYSEGLHHIHAPGDRFPRLFRRVWLGAEVLDIPTYRRELRDRHGPDRFKAAVIQDLTERRDRYCQPARHRGGKGAGPGRSSQPGAGQEEASRENSVEADALPVSASGEAPGPSSE